MNRIIQTKFELNDFPKFECSKNFTCMYVLQNQIDLSCNYMYQNWKK